MLTWQVWGLNGRLNTVTNCRDNRPAGVNTAANSFWELAVAQEAQLTTPLAAIWWLEWTPVIHPVTIRPWAATAPIISTSTSLERTSTSMAAMTTSNISTSRYLNWTSFSSSNRITINIIRRHLRRRTIASSSDISQSNCWRVVHTFRHRPPFPLKQRQPNQLAIIPLVSRVFCLLIVANFFVLPHHHLIFKFDLSCFVDFVSLFKFIFFFLFFARVHCSPVFIKSSIPFHVK